MSKKDLNSIMTLIKEVEKLTLIVFSDITLLQGNSRKLSTAFIISRLLLVNNTPN